MPRASASRVRARSTAGRTHARRGAVAPDGEVAGYTELALLPDSPSLDQYDTLVLGRTEATGSACC